MRVVPLVVGLALVSLGLVFASAASGASADEDLVAQALADDPTCEIQADCATESIPPVGQDDLPDEITGPDAPDAGVMPADPVELVSDPTFSVGFVVGAAAVGLGVYLAFRGGAKFVTRENVLENPTRYQLYEFLRANPGTHLRAVADALDLSTTNVLWHLRKLEDADLVRASKLEGYKVFYVMEGGQEGKRRAVASAVLRNDNAQEILEYIATNPGAHQREMARALTVNHGTVRWHLRKMVNADLLMQVKREHAIQYYITDLGAAVIQPEQPLVPQPATASETPAAA